MLGQMEILMKINKEDMIMKKYIYISMALAATMFAACSSDDNDIQTNNNQTNNNEEITIIAKLPQDIAKATTRVSYTDESEGSTYSVKPSWEGTEKIRYYYYNVSGNATAATTSEAITLNDGVASFTIAKGTPATNKYAYFWYPTNGYSANLSDSDPVTSCSLTPNSNKDYIYSYVNAFANRNVLMGKCIWTTTPALSGVEVDFVNVYALLKFQIKVPTTANTKIRSAKIMGWDGSSATNVGVAGTVTLTGSTGEISWSSTTSDFYYAENRDICSLSSSGDYKVGTFYALVTPQTFNGLYLEVVDNSASPVTYKFKSKKTVDIEAGYMYGIKDIVLKAE